MEKLDLIGRDLFPRSTCYHYSTFGRSYYYNCHTAWYRWGRWVLAGVLILIAVIFLLAVVCLSRRRRRARTSNYTTTSTPMATQPQTYNAPANGAYYGQGQQYVPPSGPPPPGYGNSGANADYYGGQTGGVTQPHNAYMK